MRYLSKMCVQKSILWRGPFKYNSHCAHDPMLILIWMPVYILNGQIYLFWWRECFSLVSLLFHVNSVYNAQFMQSKNVPLLVDILIVWIKWVIVWNRQSVNCFVRLLLLFFLPYIAFTECKRMVRNWLMKPFFDPHRPTDVECVS